MGVEITPGVRVETGVGARVVVAAGEVVEVATGRAVGSGVVSTTPSPQAAATSATTASEVSNGNTNRTYWRTVKRGCFYFGAGLESNIGDRCTSQERSYTR